MDNEPKSFVEWQLLLVEMERDRDKWKRMYEQLLNTVRAQAEPEKVEPSESLIRNEMYPRGRYHGD